MELGLTIPLRRHLKLKSPPCGGEGDLRLCWDLHVLSPGGKPSLFAVHASSRYAFLLYAPTRAEWADLPTLFLDGLQACLRDEGYSDVQMEAYRALAGPPVLTRTHGRRPVAFLNRAVDDLYALPAGFDEGDKNQPLLARALNGVPCRAAGHETPGTARVFGGRDLAGLGIL